MVHISVFLLFGKFPSPLRKERGNHWEIVICKYQVLWLMGFIYGAMAILTFFTLVWLDPHTGDHVLFIKHPPKRPCLSVNAE